MKIAEVLRNSIPVIAENAPMIASALGSPVAGTAIMLLSKAFGVDPSDHAALAEKVASPQAASVMKDLETDHSPWISAFLSAGRPAAVEVTIKVTW